MVPRSVDETVTGEAYDRKGVALPLYAGMTVKIEDVLRAHAPSEL